MPRLACFLVPLFPLAARLRVEPDLASEAVVIVEGNGNAAHVIAATRRARKNAIRAGLSLPQTRAILPKVIARGRDAACEHTAQEALLELAERFSPRVEDAGNGIVYLDLSGTEHLYGFTDLPIYRFTDLPEDAIADGESVDSRSVNRKIGKSENWEHALAKNAMKAADEIGLPIRVGIASSKLAARIAAEAPKTPNVIAEGDERGFLAPLPLARLAPEIDAAQTLSTWGLASIGDLASLPEAEVAARLGEAGRHLYWSARGIDPRPLMPRIPPPDFEEATDLEWPLVALEPFLFVANAALDRLAKRLEVAGLACKRLEIALRLEPDGFHVRSIDLPAPTRDVKTMLTLIRLDLEATQPGAPVAGFVFRAEPDRPRRAQLSLFGPPALSPDKLATTVARLAVLVGEDRVGTPSTVDAFRPERYAIVPYDPPAPPDTRRTPKRSRGILAVRVLRPPVPLEVITASGEGSPIRLESVEPKDNKLTRYEIRGAVRVASGPWNLEEAWWGDTPVRRDYWDIELMSGGVYRVFRERVSGEWYADGLYD